MSVGMVSIKPSLWLLCAAVIILIQHSSVATAEKNHFASISRNGVPLVRRCRPSEIIKMIRAGADVDIDSEAYDTEYDEYDEEEEEEDEIDEKLSKAAEAAMEKARKKKAEETKEKIAAVAKSRKRRKSLLKIFKLPYVVRAFLNPFTVASMTKHYFASLFNVNYLEEVRVYFLKRI